MIDVIEHSHKNTEKVGARLYRSDPLLLEVDDLAFCPSWQFGILFRFLSRKFPKPSRTKFKNRIVGQRPHCSERISTEPVKQNRQNGVAGALGLVPDARGISSLVYDVVLGTHVAVSQPHQLLKGWHGGRL